MHGLKTIERLNRDATEAQRIVEKHNPEGARLPPDSVIAKIGEKHVGTEGERDFLIGYHGSVAIITPLKTKAVQWAFANVKTHLGREGIAYVVNKPQGEELEALIRSNGFKVN